MRTSFFLVVALFLGIASGTGRALASNYYVDASQTGTGHAGASWSDAFAFLEEALQATGDGPDSICVAQGVYHPGDTSAGYNSDRSISFLLRTQVVIKGGYRGIAGIATGHADDRDFTLYETKLSGDLGNSDPTLTDNSYTVVQAGTPSDPVNAFAILEGLTIRDGYHFSPDGDGAGLYVPAGCSPTITNCTFTQNAVPAGNMGGGVFVNSADLFGTVITAFEDCTLTENEGGKGAGIAVVESIVTLTSSTVSANKFNGSGGGGFALYGLSSMDLRNCTVEYNTARAPLPGNSVVGGGGSIESHSNLLMKYCTISGNQAVGDDIEKGSLRYPV